MSALASQLTARGSLALACVWLIALLLYLPGFASLPPTDRDEARFAQASRQIRESGDLIDIRFQDEPRYKKPIGIYRLRAAAASLVGGPSNRIWPYRLPSLISALIALGLVLRLGERLFDRRVGLIAALLLAASLLLGVEARLAKTDAALLAATLASFDALAATYLGAAKRWSWVQFWVALGLGVLIKGPILPVILIFTFAALAIADRHLRWFLALRPALGVPLLLLLVAPWLAAIAVASHGAFFAESLGHDFGAKLLGGEESHGGLFFLEWYFGGRFEIRGLATIVLAGAAMYATLKFLKRDDRELGFGALLAASLALQLGGFGWMLPRLDSIWLSREAARLVAATSPCASPVVAAVGYAEPSLVFLLGTSTRLGSPQDAARLLRGPHQNGCALALVDSEADPSFRGALAGDIPRVLGQISGLDYSNGRKLQLKLYAPH